MQPTIRALQALLTLLVLSPIPSSYYAATVGDTISRRCTVVERAPLSVDLLLGLVPQALLLAGRALYNRKA